MKTWIGGQENLLSGDVITSWSTTESGGVTFQVTRLDMETIRAVIDCARAEADSDGLVSVKGLALEFGVSS